MLSIKSSIRALMMSAFILGIADAAFTQTTVHIFIRAFIPKVHTGNAGYVRPVPSNPNLFVIPNLAVNANVCNPTVTSSCFSTDNRMFSSDPQASSRAVSEIVLVIAGNTVTVEQADGRAMHRTGATHQVNCQTGVEVVPSRTAATSNMHFGTPAIAGGMVQIVVDGRASNPLVVPSPDIQYGGAFTFNIAQKTLRFSGSTKGFPAYEAYAQLNDGPMISLFQNPPAPNTTVCDLIDLGTGFQLRNVDSTVTLLDGASGKWETTDGDRRFLLEITGPSVKWTERGTTNTTPGATLTRTVTLSASGGRLRIERPNDSEVLTFLGFRTQSLRDAILAHNPQPSFISFTRSGNTLSAEWNGLTVTKNPDDSLREVVQPGVRPPRAFTFNRLP
jgi:hypothetical protein